MNSAYLDPFATNLSMTPSHTNDPWVSPGCCLAITIIAFLLSFFVFNFYFIISASMFFLDSVLPILTLLAISGFLLIIPYIFVHILE
jgi:hypothetical protein